MKGYKAFYFDLTCRPTDMAVFQYEIGGTYKIDGAPVICLRGFHFCRALGDVYKYYPASFDIRICEVEALGECDWNVYLPIPYGYPPPKMATNKLRIIRELEPADIKSALVDGSFDGKPSPLSLICSSIRSSIRRFNDAPHVYFLWEDARGYFRFPKDDRETEWLMQRARLWTDALSDTKTSKEEKKE